VKSVNDMLLMLLFLQERYVMNVADLISVSLLLCITPAVKEAVPNKGKLCFFWSGLLMTIYKSFFFFFLNCLGRKIY
jgi:hypothetical protein